MFSIESLRGATPVLQPRLSTGVPSLDAVLGGGLRLGQLVEISGLVGTGRSSLALSMGLRCLAVGQTVAWIESTSGLWPLPSLEAGLPLDQFLLVHAPPSERLRALQLLLTCPGAATLAVVDLAGAPTGREIAAHQLVKLHHLAERASAAVLFLTERSPSAPSLGVSIDVRLHLDPMTNAGGEDVFARTLAVRILRHKQGSMQGSFSEVLHGPDRLRLRSTL
jgi:protein ImuA